MELSQEVCFVFTLEILVETAGFSVYARIKQACLFFRHFRFYHRNTYASNVSM